MRCPNFRGSTSWMGRRRAFLVLLSLDLRRPYAEVFRILLKIDLMCFLRSFTADAVCPLDTTVTTLVSMINEMIHEAR